MAGDSSEVARARATFKRALAWLCEMVRRCPECGGELMYNRDTKLYVCRGCGRMFTRDELEAEYEKLAEERGQRARSLGARRRL